MVSHFKTTFYQFFIFNQIDKLTIYIRFSREVQYNGNWNASQGDHDQ